MKRPPAGEEGSAGRRLGSKRRADFTAALKTQGSARRRSPTNILSNRSNRSRAVDTTPRIRESSSSVATVLGSSSGAPPPMRRTVPRMRSARKIARAR